MKQFKDALSPYKVRIGTIRFPLAEPVAATLIAAIAKHRAKEEAERVKVKPATKKR